MHQNIQLVDQHKKGSSLWEGDMPRRISQISFSAFSTHCTLQTTFFFGFRGSVKNVESLQLSGAVRVGRNLGISSLFILIPFWTLIYTRDLRVNNLEASRLQWQRAHWDLTSPGIKPGTLGIWAHNCEKRRITSAIRCCSCCRNLGISSLFIGSIGARSLCGCSVFFYV